jgi:hypothetical protein
LKRDDVKLVSRSCGLALFLAGGAIHCGGDEVVVAASDGSVSIADTDADLDTGTGGGDDAAERANDSGRDASAMTDGSVTPEAAVDAQGDERSMVDSPVTREDGGDAGFDAGGTGACAMICAGCCDVNDRCQAGTATTVCGASGAMCQSCSTHSCTLSTPCCKAGGGCGCALAGVIGCN